MAPQDKREGSRPIPTIHNVTRTDGPLQTPMLQQPENPESDCEILLPSCSKHMPVWPIWAACAAAYVPGMNLRWRIVSDGSEALAPGWPVFWLKDDVGWCSNLLAALSDRTFTFVWIEDFVPAPSTSGQRWADNVASALSVMRRDPSVGLLRLSMAHEPELPYHGWDRVGEYDRESHPFKRASLQPGIWRTDFLRRLMKALLAQMPASKDVGVQGAYELEVDGTRLLCDAGAWPERCLGTRRAMPLLSPIIGDIVHAGRFKCGHAEWALIEATGLDVGSIPGLWRLLDSASAA